MAVKWASRRLREMGSGHGVMEQDSVGGLPAQRPLEPNGASSAGLGFFLASHGPSAQCARESRGSGVAGTVLGLVSGCAAPANQRRAV